MGGQVNASEIVGEANGAGLIHISSGCLEVNVISFGKGAKIYVQ